MPSWEKLFGVAGRSSELHVSVEKKKNGVRNSVALWIQPFGLNAEKEVQVCEPRKGCLQLSSRDFGQGDPLLNLPAPLLKLSASLGKPFLHLPPG